MEAENNIVTKYDKGHWVKLDDNYYRQLQVELSKTRRGNLLFGLTVGTFIGFTNAIGLNLILAYKYFNVFMYYVVSWLPFVMGVLLILMSYVTTMYATAKELE